MQKSSLNKQNSQQWEGLPGQGGLDRVLSKYSHIRVLSEQQLENIKDLIVKASAQEIKEKGGLVLESLRFREILEGTT